MHGPIGRSSITHLHGSWQLAVHTLDTKGDRIFLRDVPHIKKFRSLKKLIVSSAADTTPANALPGWQLIAKVGPSLANLCIIDLSGTSSFEVLKVLQCLEQLRQRITALRIHDPAYSMTSSDMLCLADLQALDALDLACNTLPRDSDDATAAARDALKGSLKALSLVTASHSQAEVLAAFPGSLTSLTALQLDNGAGSQGDLPPPEHEAGNVAAIAGLVNLEDLELHCALMSPQAQQQALGALTRLKRLCLKSKQQDSLAVIPSPDSLLVLEVPTLAVEGAVADAVLGLAKLERLHALMLQPSEQWRDKDAAGSRIENLALKGPNITDDTLRNIPKLPLLKRFEAVAALGDTAMLWPACISPSGSRYLSLARLLLRQAATLESISLTTTSEFSELLPLELPVCRRLALGGAPLVTGDLLRALSGCKMPALERLSMHPQSVPDQLQLELGWLAQLPALKSLHMSGFAQQTMQQVQGMMEGRVQVTG